MITIDDIIKWSKPHPATKMIANDKGRLLRIGDDNITLSIVGGSRGLYGDFKDTFELAIFDNTSGNFMTRYYVGGNDDVVPYMPADELVELVNSIIKSDKLKVNGKDMISKLD